MTYLLLHNDFRNTFQNFVTMPFYRELGYGKRNNSVAFPSEDGHKWTLMLNTHQGTDVKHASYVRGILREIDKYITETPNKINPYKISNKQD